MLAFVTVTVMVLWLPSVTDSLPGQKQAEMTPVSGRLASIVPKSARPMVIPEAKVVMANTRKVGSPIWGLTAAEADQACQAIAKAESGKGIRSNPAVGTLWQPLLGRLFYASTRERKGDVNEVQGHLLSIGSKLELDAVIGVLGKRKQGIYWTGGKLVLRPSRNVTQRLNQPQTDLFWTDGSNGSLDVLGLSTEDLVLLTPKREYCLALDLWLGRWQVRCCNDRLAYACKLRSIPQVTQEYPPEDEWTNHDEDLHSGSTEGSQSQSHEKASTDSTTPTAITTPPTASTIIQTTPVETTDAQTTPTASTEEISSTHGSTSPLAVHTSTESPESPSTTTPDRTFEGTSENTISSNPPEETTDLQESALTLTTINAHHIASESTISSTASKETTPTRPQLQAVRAFDEMTSTHTPTTPTTNLPSSDVSHSTPLTTASTLSPTSTSVTARPVTNTPFMTAGSEAVHSSTALHTETPHSITAESSAATVSTEYSNSPTLSVTSAASNIATTTGTIPAHDKSTEATTISTTLAVVGSVNDSGSTSSSGTTPTNGTTAPKHQSSTNPQLVKANGKMTTPEMSQSTTSESTVASTPIAAGAVGSATVGHTTMSTSSTSHLTTSLPPASTTAAEMPAKASTQSPTVNTPAVAEVAGVVTRETVSTHSTLTLTPSMTQQTELTPTTIPSTATAFTRTARETTWSSMMRGDSSVPSGSTLPATPHSTNPKLTEAAGNVAETAKLSTSASTPGVKGAAGTLPTDRYTATETASPDAQKMTVGRQIRSASTTPTISTTDVSFSTPGSKEPESSQITTSTQTKSGATTAAHHLATQTDKHLLTPASLPSHGSSPAEIGLPNTVSPAPLARTTVSQQTTQAAGPAAGLWEDGHTTKEGHHGTLITTPMSVKNTPPEGSSVGTNRLSTATPSIRGAAGRPVEGPQISSSSIPHGTSVENTITTSTTKQPEAQTTSTLRSVGTSPRETTAHPVQTPVVSSMATESKALAKNKVIASVAGIFEAGAPSTESLSSSPVVTTTTKPPHASSVTRRRPRLDDVDDHDDDDKDDYDDDVNEPDDDDYRPTTSLLWTSVFD